MKNMVSYLLLPMLVCTYMATSMGYGVHTCHKEGRSRIMFLSSKEKCACDHDRNCDEEGPKDCCGNPIKQETPEHKEPCCETSLYTLENERDIVAQVSFGIESFAFHFVPFVVSNDLVTPFDSASCHLYSPYLVRGPDGGLDAITPLRL